jgi:hypothetical protein
VWAPTVDPRSPFAPRRSQRPIRIHAVQRAPARPSGGASETPTHAVRQEALPQSLRATAARPELASVRSTRCVHPLDRRSVKYPHPPRADRKRDRPFPTSPLRQCTSIRLSKIPLESPQPGAHRGGLRRERRSHPEPLFKGLRPLDEGLCEHFRTAEKGLARDDESTSRLCDPRVHFSRHSQRPCPLRARLSPTLGRRDNTKGELRRARPRLPEVGRRTARDDCRLFPH